MIGASCTRPDRKPCTVHVGRERRLVFRRGLFDEVSSVDFQGFIGVAHFQPRCSRLSRPGERQFPTADTDREFAGSFIRGENLLEENQDLLFTPLLEG